MVYPAPITYLVEVVSFFLFHFVREYIHIKTSLVRMIQSYTDNCVDIFINYTLEKHNVDNMRYKLMEKCFHGTQFSTIM